MEADSLKQKIRMGLDFRIQREIKKKQNKSVLNNSINQQIDHYKIESLIDQFRQNKLLELFKACIRSNRPDKLGSKESVSTLLYFNYFSCRIAQKAHQNNRFMLKLQDFLLLQILQRIMQLSSKQKKFTHNRMKACLERNQQEDKENKNIHQDFKNKKFSVELPYRCSNEPESHQKSIFNEQISVILNTSNIRNLGDRDLLGSDIKKLTQALSMQRQDRPSLCQILENSQTKSIQMKFLIERLLKHLKEQKKYHNSSIVSQKDQYYYESVLSETQMMPYIERQIDVLKRNYDKLLQQKENYLSISKIGRQQKQKMLQALKQIHESQLYELSQHL